MTDTPIIDAAARAGFVRGWNPGDGDNSTEDWIRCIVIDALRIANPWTPTAEEIDAMARVYTSGTPLSWQNSAEAWRALVRESVLRIYRARLIVGELYDSDGVPR